ncbi:MAG: GtrA family protein [Candidatus Cryptobacteroides sp.]
MKLKNLLNRLFKSEFIRFAIVGVIATGIHYGLYLLLKLFINVNIAYTLGYLTSLVCNFWLTARFTFKSGVSALRGVGFVLSHVVNYLLHIGLLNIFLKLGIPSSLAPIPVYCIAVPVNFLLVRTVFRKL